MVVRIRDHTNNSHHHLPWLTGEDSETGSSLRAPRKTNYSSVPSPWCKYPLCNIVWFIACLCCFGGVHAVWLNNLLIMWFKSAVQYQAMFGILDNVNGNVTSIIGTHKTHYNVLSSYLLINFLDPDLFTCLFSCKI